MLRGFTDCTGVEWRVWEVFPSQGGDESAADQLSRTSLKDTAFANGWLCFESPAEKRRLAPIPSGWQFGDAPYLEQMRDRAVPVVARRRGQTA